MNTDTDIEQEFLAAYDQYANLLYKHCYFRVFTAERAEELVQDTFMKTWDYLRSGKKVDNLKAFLYRVANNLIIDHARKKKNDSLEALMEAGAQIEPSYSTSERIEQNLIMEQVKKAMAQLSDDERQLLILRYIDDLDPKEIAEMLHISANNVSVRLNRAIKELQKFMPQEIL